MSAISISREGNPAPRMALVGHCDSGRGTGAGSGRVFPRTALIHGSMIGTTSPSRTNPHQLTGQVVGYGDDRPSRGPSGFELGASNG
jgi:hypothetical protein